MYTPQYNKQAHPGKMRTAGCVAFVLICLSILSSCASPFAGNRQTTAPVRIDIPTPTPGPSHPVTLQDIKMFDDQHSKTFDDQHGWALTHDKNHVLYTVTSAKQWLDVTPNTHVKQYSISTAMFLDSQDAWVAVQSGTHYSIYYTFNGGGLWAETPLLTENGTITQISFIDKTNGWLVLDRGPSSTGSEEIDLFRSVDGGASWDPITSTDPTKKNVNGQLPSIGDKTGLAFHDSSNGWFTGTVPIDNHVWLYTTHNGGNDWTLQTFALPSDKDQATTMPPSFFDATHGILPVLLSTGDSRQLDIFTTDDAGTNWHSTTPTAGLTGMISFFDSSHGWAVGSENSRGSVYGTTDGGLHWNLLVPQLAPNITAITRLDFISATEGWALASTGSDTLALFQTSDGGKTWVQIDTSAS